MEFIVRKRLYSIIVENLENVCRHSHDYFQATAKRHTVSTIFVVSNNTDHFSVLTGNFILNDKISIVKAKLESVNSMDKDRLQSFYRDKLLQSGEMGGGVGIIEISLKSGAKISYEFKPVDEQVSFFVMQTRLNK
jgi:hypothetical protein